MDQESLRLLIQHKIRDRRLPHDGIRTVSSTPSDGEMCDACDTVLTKDQSLMEGFPLDLGRRPFQMHSDVSRSGTTNGAPPNGRRSHPRSHPAEAPRWPTAAWQRSESVRTSRELAEVRRLREDYAQGPAHDGGLPADKRKGRSLSRRLLHALERGAARAGIVASTALTPLS
jgi:hypothetical protein